MLSEERHVYDGPSTAEEYGDGPPPLDPSWWEAVLTEAENGELPPESADDNSNQLPGENPFTDQPTKKHPNEINWESVQELFEQDQLVELVVTGFNRGGLLVEGQDMHGFVPISHLLEIRCEEKEREKRLGTYVKRTLMLKIIECDPKNGRVVFSERAALTEPGTRIQLLNNIQSGDCVRGVVTNITDFGAFVDLGGVEGLVHVSEMSWGRVQHPADVVTPGQDVEAYVLQVEPDRSRIALSFKQLQQNPWATVAQRYYPGMETIAVVTSIVPFGVFARLEEGLDGLIHISEMDLKEGEKIPENMLHEGQDIRVQILHVDVEKQRLGLSLVSDH